MDHAAITKIVAPNGYGKGVSPNPFAVEQKEWRRRQETGTVRHLITHKIEALFEPRFITPPETAECIEALITMTDSRTVLELGTCTGFTTLHILRAIYGKEGALLVSVDARPEHDRDFWALPQFKGMLRHIEGWTPDCLAQLNGKAGEGFDFVFVDTDHSIEHTSKELDALWGLTRPGSLIVFHDVPEWMAPNNRRPPPIRDYLLNHPNLRGLCLRSCEQMDCLDTWGHGYPIQCNPGLGVFQRKQ